MYKRLDRLISGAVCGPVFGVTAQGSKVFGMLGLGFIIAESTDIVQDTELFVGLDGKEVVMLPLSDKCVGRFARLRCIALVGTVSRFATS